MAKLATGMFLLLLTTSAFAGTVASGPVPQDGAVGASVDCYVTNIGKTHLSVEADLVNVGTPTTAVSFSNCDQPIPPGGYCHMYAAPNLSAFQECIVSGSKSKLRGNVIAYGLDGTVTA